VFVIHRGERGEMEVDLSIEPETPRLRCEPRLRAESPQFHFEYHYDETPPMLAYSPRCCAWIESRFRECEEAVRQILRRQCLPSKVYKLRIEYFRMNTGLGVQFYYARDALYQFVTLSDGSAGAMLKTEEDAFEPMYAAQYDMTMYMYENRHSPVW